MHAITKMIAGMARSYGQNNTDEMKKEWILREFFSHHWLY